MVPLKCAISIEGSNKEEWVCVKVLDRSLHDPRSIALLGEMCESLLMYMYPRLCIDLSTVELVTSTVFGTVFNVQHTAQDQKKTLKLRLNKDAMETARDTGAGDVLVLEQVG
jgi:hypothetical protein